MAWIPPPDEWRILIRLFGPPRVAMVEAYGAETTGTRFDHNAFDTLLRRHVHPGGLVDYNALADDVLMLDGYIEALANIELPALSRNEKLALFINAYNAFTLRLIIDSLPVASVRDIPARDRWVARRWRIGRHTLSLHEIENRWLRARFIEPRVHFALNCASIGCPPLRARAYTGPSIAQELEAQSQAVHRDRRWAHFDGTTLYLSKIYLWYRHDFRQDAGGPVFFASQYLPELADALAIGKPPRIRWLPYDWKLNTLA